MCVHVYVCMHMCECWHVCVCTHIHVRMYTFVHICTYVPIRVCVCAYGDQRSASGIAPQEPFTVSLRPGLTSRGSLGRLVWLVSEAGDPPVSLPAAGPPRPPLLSVPGIELRSAGLPGKHFADIATPPPPAALSKTFLKAVSCTLALGGSYSA